MTIKVIADKLCTSSIISRKKRERLILKFIFTRLFSITLFNYKRSYDNGKEIYPKLANYLETLANLVTTAFSGCVGSTWSRGGRKAIHRKWTNIMTYKGVFKFLCDKF